MARYSFTGKRILAASSLFDPSVDGGYPSHSERSIATPHVSGIVAFLFDSFRVCLVWGFGEQKEKKMENYFFSVLLHY